LPDATVGNLKIQLKGQSFIFEAGCKFMNSFHKANVFDDLFETMVFGIRVPSTIATESGETITTKYSQDADLVGNLVESEFLL
jgi:hypothetical protein